MYSCGSIEDYYSTQREPPECKHLAGIHADGAAHVHCVRLHRCACTKDAPLVTCIRLKLSM